MRLGIRAKDKQVAVAANTPCRPPELHRHDDEADEPEDEEDEGADEDDRGQQAALVDEGEEEDDEGDDEGGDGYVVGEVPGRERVSLAWVEGGMVGDGRADHGTGRPRVCWVWMNVEKTPMMQHEAMSMMSIQRLSCQAGHW